MHVDQIEGNIWPIKGEALKGRKGKTSDFRVPLSSQLLVIIDQARAGARDWFLSPSVPKGVISDATIPRLMERRGITEPPHVFRPSFRDWVVEEAKTLHDVAETALGHVVGGAVERAYKRTDHLEQRSALMQRWADYATGQNSKTQRIGW